MELSPNLELESEDFYFILFAPHPSSPLTVQMILISHPVNSAGVPHRNMTQTSASYQRTVTQ